MKRPEQIENHLSALEQPKISARLAGWEANLVVMYRRDFSRTGDLNDNQFETLEKIRHRADPPPLPGRNGKDAPAASCWDMIAKAVEANPDGGKGIVHLNGRHIEISWAKLIPAPATADLAKQDAAFSERLRDEIKKAQYAKAYGASAQMIAEISKSTLPAKDLRVCTDPGENNYITKDKIYEIVKDERGWATYIGDHGQEISCYSHRFSKA